MTLTFVNVNTANIYKYERSECPDDFVQFVRQALKKSGVLWKGWSVIVRHTSPDQAHFDLSLDSVPITHCWLCLDAKAATAVWQKIVDTKPPIMAMSRPPDNVPWLAMSMTMESLPVVLKTPHRIAEAPAVEVSLAWALIPDT